MQTSFRPQPGWATPIVVDHGKVSFVAWLLRGRKHDDGCLARRQGRCPGRDQCHDCAWTSQRSG